MSETRQATLVAGQDAARARNIGTILLLAIIWGLSIPVTKLGLETLPPMTLTALRFATALPVLFVLSLRQRLPMRAVPRVALLGIIGVTVGQVAQTYGIAGTSASVGAILSATIPVFVLVFAVLRLRQRATPRQLLGLLAASAGIVLVALAPGGEKASVQATTATGVVWMLLSSIAIAFYYVWSAELTSDHGTPAVAAWSTLFGFLALLPWTAMEMSDGPLTLTAPALAVATYLGVFVTAAGLFLWLHLLRTVTAVVATSVQYLHPVVGILVGAAIFGDSLGMVFAAGVTLILGGLALAIAPARGDSSAGCGEGDITPPQRPASPQARC
jgi:drug/metabolite transporter (DMT)-like permease